MIAQTSYEDAVITEQLFDAMIEEKATDARYEYFAYVGVANIGLLKYAINFGYVGV